MRRTSSCIVQATSGTLQGADTGNVDPQPGPGKEKGGMMQLPAANSPRINNPLASLEKTLKSLIGSLALARKVRALQSSFRPIRPVARDRKPFVLLMASFLPPVVTGGVYRPLSWLKYADAEGWRIEAMTGELRQPATPAGIELARDIPDTASVTRVSSPRLPSSWRMTPHIDGDYASAIEIASEARKKFASDPPDVVVGTGPWFSEFVAAYYVARSLGARLVLDYRDEWTQCPFDFVKTGPSDLEWEAKCLAAANKVIFTTERQRQHQIATFNIDPAKCIVVPNGWETSEFELAAGVPLLSDRLTLTFAGFLGKHTDPRPFLEMLQKCIAEEPSLAAQLRVRFIGDKLRELQEAIEAFQPPGVMQSIGLVPKRQAIAAMQESHALLLFASADLARYMPGKMFDYLATGRPVLIIGEPGTASDYVQQLSAGYQVRDGDWKGLRNVIAQLGRVSANSLNHPREAWLTEHTRANLARLFFGQLRALL